MRSYVTLLCILSAATLQGSNKKESSLPFFDYDVARTHEIKPHRRLIPMQGANYGFHQLHLDLLVSSKGDVVNASANGNEEALRLWPRVRDEVLAWKFVPFKKHGTVTAARVEEYLDFVPEERFPEEHVPAPSLRPDSKVAITLERTGCYGTCPSYLVKVTTEGIEFEGRQDVATTGKRTATVDGDEVRKLAQKFVAADFYSMDDKYVAGITDNPTYVLSITIDGQMNRVVDYVGFEVGMPAVIRDLEDDVDNLAQTRRWIRRKT